MAIQSFIIPFRLPGLNDYINTCRRNKYEAAMMKAETERRIALHTLRLRPVVAPCFVQTVFREADKRRDVDNIESAKKFILDALVKKGILQGDSPRYVVGAPSYTEYGPGAGVEVTIFEDADAESLRRLLQQSRRIFTEDWEDTV